MPPELLWGKTSVQTYLEIKPRNINKLCVIAQYDPDTRQEKVDAEEAGDSEWSAAVWRTDGAVGVKVHWNISQLLFMSVFPLYSGGTKKHSLQSCVQVSVVKRDTSRRWGELQVFGWDKRAHTHTHAQREQQGHQSMEIAVQFCRVTAKSASPGENGSPAYFLCIRDGDAPHTHPA